MSPAAPERAYPSGHTRAGTGRQAGGGTLGRTGSRGRQGSPRRATALIVGGVVVGIVVLIIVLSSIGGGGSSPSAAHRASGSSLTSAGSHQTHAKASAKRSSSRGAAGSSGAQAARPSEVNVAVLNGTETTGLAHHVSEELRQGGYERATPLAGRPPGANSASVVEYARGHHADASEVARAVGIAHVEPMEGPLPRWRALRQLW